MKENTQLALIWIMVVILILIGIYPRKQKNDTILDEIGGHGRIVELGGNNYGQL